MCGIAGIAGALATEADQASTIVENMCDAIAHRGPDGAGCWSSATLPVTLGHRRLAIIDTSDAAAQPMVDTDTGGAITFNGEIYNYRDLARRQRGHSRRSSGDTAVLLSALGEFGVVPTLAQARGMFAFAYLDARSATLTLARDRFGERPLYYSVWNGSLLFASELKGLRRVPDFPAEIDHAALEEFMRHSCIGSDRTIYRSVHKVLPGELIRVDVSGRIDVGSIRREQFWDAAAVALDAAESPLDVSIDEAADELDELLGNAAMLATVSDVPLGAFLSGGIDSTSIVSQLSRRTTAPVRTFTIGFGAHQNSEADAAQAIAHHLGTHHTELTVTPHDALEVIPRLADIFDEPFGDSSQIPTYLVSELARRHVSVALTGDGGDELFGGYPRFQKARQLWRGIHAVPRPARETVAKLLARRACTVARDATDDRQHHATENRLTKAASLMGATAIDDVYALFVTSFWEQSPLARSCEPEPLRLPSGHDEVQRLCLRETLTYLPNDILTKVDRAAMSVSLESRVPMLDPDVFAFSHRLESSLKINGSESKRVLRHLLARHVPRSLWNRPKQGFGIPLGDWLRGPLRPWGADMLAPRALASHGLLDPTIVQSLWDEHQRGDQDWGARLWNLITFQCWYERWMGPQ